MAGVLNVLEKNFRKNPTKLAVISGIDELSYRNLHFGSISFANYLEEIGILPTQKIFIRASHDITLWCAFIGSMIHRTTLVIIDESLPVSKIEVLCSKYRDIALIISNNELDDKIGKRISFEELRYHCKFGHTGPHKTFKDINDDDITNIIYTTGTTGEAKGVCWNYKYLWCSNFLPGSIPFNSKTVAIIVGKLNHTFGLGMGLSVLLKNGTFASFDSLIDVAGFYNQLDEYKVNSVIVPPSILSYLAFSNINKLNKISKKIKLINLSGEKTSKRAQYQLSEVFNKARLFISYGSTELGHIGCYEFSKFGASEDRVMKIEETPEIAFFDENKNVITNISKNNPGYIGIKMPFKIPGYFENGNLNQIILHNDYAIMNDLGYLDDGFLCLSGRAGDIINSGSIKTNPLYVEEAAISSGMIKDCVCYGTKDLVFGKIVTLDIVVRNNFDKKEFKKILKNNLPKEHIPKIINVVPFVKRTEGGCQKIDRKYYRNK